MSSSVPRPALTLTRRRFAQSGVLAALAAAGVLRSSAADASAATFPDSAFASVRARWVDLLTGGSFDPTDPTYTDALRHLSATAVTLLSSLDTSANRTALFPDLPIGKVSANVTTTFVRLRAIATAVVTPGTSLTGDTGVATSVIDGLDFMAGGPYSAAAGTTGKMPGYGNWWDWQIGAPRALQDTAVLLHAHLSATQIAAYCAAIDHFVPDPTRQHGIYGTTTSTGANRLDLCRVSIIRGALGDNGDAIGAGVDGVTPTLSFVNTGDGLHPDWSWIQHTNGAGVGIAYTGTYGEVWLGDVALLQGALAGSAWTLDTTGFATASRSGVHAFAPFVFDGVMMDAVRGRAISRSEETGWDDGMTVASTIAQLGDAGSGSATGRQLLSIAKGWLVRSPLPVSDTGKLPAQILAHNLTADDSVHAAPEPIRHDLFPAMDRAVHRRDGWAVCVSMASNRIAYYETGNNENLRGWHTGDGMTAVYRHGSADHYDDGFWPTVDPYRLPGITASLLPLADAQGGAWANPAPATPWAGGATDGEFAAIGMQLHGPFSTLRGAKSWFCIGDAVICLGSDISAQDGYEVDTAVDNRILPAGASIRVNGKPVTGPTTVTAAGWASIDGYAAYVFPTGHTTLTVRQESRTGSWADIGATTANAGLPPVTRDYGTLYLNHGTDPSDAGYAYLLLPGASDKVAKAYAHKRDWLHVTARDATAHGVEIASLATNAATFWTAGRAGRLTASGPCAVMIREDHRAGTATVCVADPTRTQTSLTVTWDRPVRAVASAPHTVTSSSTGRRLVLAFGDLTGAAGMTQTVTVRTR